MLILKVSKSAVRYKSGPWEKFCAGWILGYTVPVVGCLIAILTMLEGLGFRV